jgi:hypothetical protein
MQPLIRINNTEMVTMKINKLWFDNERIYIENNKGEILSQLLMFYPRLKNAAIEQRDEWKQSYGGLHWKNIDEDISFESFMWADDDPTRLYHIAS